MTKIIALFILYAIIIGFLIPSDTDVNRKRLSIPPSLDNIHEKVSKLTASEDVERTLSQIIESLGTASNQWEAKKEISASNGLFDVHEKISDHKEAEKHFLTLLDLYEQQRDGPALADTLNRLGNIYVKIGPVEKSLNLFERSVDVCDSLQDAGKKIAAMNNLAAAYIVLGQYQNALDNYESGLTLAVRTWNQTSKGRLLTKIGIVQQMLDRGSVALEYFDKALKVQSDDVDPVGKAVTFNSMARLRRAWAQYAVAIDLCDKALKDARQNGEGYPLAELLLTKALVLQDLGNYDEGAESATEALHTSRQASYSRGICESLRVLAQLESFRGDPQKALDLCDEALDFSVALADNNEAARSFLAKAAVLSNGARYHEVGQYLYRALALKKALGVPLDEVIDASAELSIKSGKGLANAKQLLVSYPLRDGRRQSILLGRMALKRGEFKEARDHFHLVAEDHLPIIRFAATVGLGLADEGWGLLSEAKHAYEKAIRQAEEIRDSLNASQRKNFFQSEDQGVARTAPYEGLSRVLLKLAQPYESLRVAEMTKARAFSDAIVGTSNRGMSNASDNVIQDDDEMNEKFHEINLLHGMHRTPFGVSEWAGSLQANLRAKREEHIRKLRDMYPLYAAARYPEPMDLNQSALHPHEWVLEYQVTETGVMVFLIQGHTIRYSMFRSIPQDELNKLIHQFKTPLDVTNEAELLPKLWTFDFEAGKRLADILLGDTISLVPAREPIIVVPDTHLGLIPFEMLVLKGSGVMSLDSSGTPCTKNVTFLGDRNPISYYQSITALTLTRLQSKKQSRKNRQLIMVDPVFSFEDPRVGGARPEAAQTHDRRMDPGVHNFLMSIRNRLTFPRLGRTLELGLALMIQDPLSTDLYEGMDASKTILFQNNLTDYEAIVIASHGYVGNDIPGLREPVLVLTLIDQPEGQDGFLRMTEIMALRLNSEIVALTACKTGTGNYVRGEGTMFLGRAFQTSGARTVLVSLWNIGEEASIDLIKSFFNYLRAGRGKLEALNQARTAIREKWEHPFFWASFILVGETE